MVLSLLLLLVLSLLLLLHLAVQVDFYNFQLLSVCCLGGLPPAWTACTALAEPGTAVATTIHSLAAAAMQQHQQQDQREQHQQQREQEQQDAAQKQKQQQQVRQHLELCLGVGWVAACARDVTGSFSALGLEGKLRLFQLCDPAGKRRLSVYLACYQFVGPLLQSL